MEDVPQGGAGGVPPRHQDDETKDGPSHGPGYGPGPSGQESGETRHGRPEPPREDTSEPEPEPPPSRSDRYVQEPPD